MRKNDQLSLQNIADELLEDIFLPIDLKNQEKKLPKQKYKMIPKNTQENFQQPKQQFFPDKISVSSQSSKNKKIIGTDHHLFFFPIKAKNARNPCFFLFNFPFICIYNVDSNYPEIEILPKSTTVTIEGKFLIIDDQTSTRKFPIKLEKDKIDFILQNDEISPLAYYIKCQLIIPELSPTYIINEFYYPKIYNTHFLLSISNLQIDKDQLVYWVVAGEYAFEPLIAYLFKADIKSSLTPEKCFKKDSFIVKAGSAIFRNDRFFLNFIEKISNLKTVTFDKYLEELSKLPFSKYSMLMIHLLYKTAIEFYNLPAHAYHLIGSFLYKAGIEPNIKNNKTITEISRLHKFNYASVPLPKLAAFEKILSNFELYPIDFEEPVFDNSNFEAFMNLEKTIDLSNQKFLEAIRNTKSIQSELSLNNFDDQ